MNIHVKKSLSVTEIDEHLCNKNPPESIGDRRVHTNEVELY
jgi:hypothetical protein